MSTYYNNAFPQHQNVYQRPNYPTNPTNSYTTPYSYPNNQYQHNYKPKVMTSQQYQDYTGPQSPTVTSVNNNISSWNTFNVDHRNKQTQSHAQLILNYDKGVNSAFSPLNILDSKRREQNEYRTLWDNQLNMKYLKNGGIHNKNLCSRDIYIDEIAEKELEKRRKDQYNKELQKQIEEQRQRRMLEKQREKEEDLKFEEKYREYQKQINNGNNATGISGGSAAGVGVGVGVGGGYNAVRPFSNNDSSKIRLSGSTIVGEGINVKPMNYTNSNFNTGATGKELMIDDSPGKTGNNESNINTTILNLMQRCSNGTISSEILNQGNTHYNPMINPGDKSTVTSVPAMGEYSDKQLAKKNTYDAWRFSFANGNGDNNNNANNISTRRNGPGNESGYNKGTVNHPLPQDMNAAQWYLHNSNSNFNSNNMNTNFLNSFSSNHPDSTNEVSSMLNTWIENNFKEIQKQPISRVRSMERKLQNNNDVQQQSSRVFTWNSQKQMTFGEDNLQSINARAPHDVSPPKIDLKALEYRSKYEKYVQSKEDTWRDSIAQDYTDYNNTIALKNTFAKDGTFKNTGSFTDTNKNEELMASMKGESKWVSADKDYIETWKKGQLPLAEKGEIYGNSNNETLNQNANLMSTMNTSNKLPKKSEVDTTYFENQGLKVYDDILEKIISVTNDKNYSNHPTKASNKYKPSEVHQSSKHEKGKDNYEDDLIEKIKKFKPKQTTGSVVNNYGGDDKIESSAEFQSTWKSNKGYDEFNATDTLKNIQREVYMDELIESSLKQIKENDRLERENNLYHKIKDNTSHDKDINKYTDKYDNPSLSLSKNDNQTISKVYKLSNDLTKTRSKKIDQKASKEDLSHSNSWEYSHSNSNVVTVKRENSASDYNEQLPLNVSFSDIEDIATNQNKNDPKDNKRTSVNNAMKDDDEICNVQYTEDKEGDTKPKTPVHKKDSLQTKINYFNDSVNDLPLKSREIKPEILKSTVKESNVWQDSYCDKILSNVDLYHNNIIDSDEDD